LSWQNATQLESRPDYSFGIPKMMAKTISRLVAGYRLKDLAQLTRVSSLGQALLRGKQVAFPAVWRMRNQTW
jgi:hypothetical protein